MGLCQISEEQSLYIQVHGTYHNILHKVDQLCTGYIIICEQLCTVSAMLIISKSSVVTVSHTVPALDHRSAEPSPPNNHTS